jgi:hypothetical protein
MPALSWKRRWLALGLLSGALLSFAVLLRPAPVLSDASGFTYIADYSPSHGGYCIRMPGIVCYQCEHTTNGVTRNCSETPDGTVSYYEPFYPPPNG